MPREMFKHGSEEFTIVNYLLRLPPGSKVRSSTIIRISGAVYGKLLSNGYIKEEGDKSDPLITLTEKFYQNYGYYVDFEK